jgi:hypothetical protein
MLAKSFRRKKMLRIQIDTTIKRVDIREIQTRNVHTGEPQLILALAR